MDETKNRIRDYWDERSYTFDNSPGHVIRSESEEEAWKVLLKEKLGEVEKILDAGAGTGFLSILLAKMGYNVVGVDISEKMLERAKEKAEENAVKVDFRIGDAQSLPFKDEFFDAIVNRAVLWTLPDPENAIREWKRLLKPEGKLCLFLHEPHARGVSQTLRRQIGNLLILLVERRNPWNSLDGKKGIHLPFKGGVEPAVIVNLLEKVGFESVSAEPMEEIGKLQRQKMSLRYKIAHSNHFQFCYTAIKPSGGGK
jgi:ubiquinone/menaquinone biosynthesis C-methylase UbiE